ncbi:acyltransferase [Sphingomonas aliaeris]|uniref:Acyltransferase n=1 Tax=Sphingomonas aliaeris TaxID=2759526 RepID=A0A974S500_9SPHN|nr:acyltransferase [Sphingomonas aliaeris]QQV78039.1 acyltransferase [Sphingomonas aliaeris]
MSEVLKPMSLSNFRGKSFKDILDLNRGMGLGFDVIRLGLAVLILLSHTSGIIGTNGTITAIMNWIFQIDGDSAAKIASAATINATAVATPGHEPYGLTGLGRPITLSYLPMFFALSGFLVTGSALRTRKLLPFLGLRVLRLLPALFVEVALSAVILGAVFTTLDLSAYYSSAGFWNYFWNIVGHVQFHLPGVFEQNRSTIVNANLWTLPWEFYCYLAMSLVIVAGLLGNRIILTVMFLCVTVVSLVLSFSIEFQVVPAHLSGFMLIYYFLAGMMFFLWREKIIFHEAIFVACAIVCYILMMSPRTVFIYPLLLTYMTVFIGLFPMRQFKLLKTGDYSYGIYLYGYPVTQALVTAIPALKTSLVFAAPAALAATALFAALSWHGVEKHCLKLKRYLSPKSAKINETLHPDAGLGNEGSKPDARPEGSA